MPQPATAALQTGRYSLVFPEALAVFCTHPLHFPAPIRNLAVIPITRTFLILFLSALLVSSVAEAKSPSEEARTQIEAILRKGDASGSKGDSNDYWKHVADDFLGADIAGNVFSKKQSQQIGESSKAASSGMTFKTSLKSLSLKGDKAYVVTHEHTVVRVLGQRTGKLHTVVFEGLWRSIWSNKSGQWKMWRTKQINQTITTDGKKRVVPAKNDKISW